MKAYKTVPNPEKRAPLATLLNTEELDALDRVREDLLGGISRSAALRELVLRADRGSQP